MKLDWDPIKDIVSIQQRVNAIFEDTLARSRTYSSSLPRSPWSPPVDIFETDDCLIIQMELPGVGKETVSVEVRDNTLSIKGETKFDKRMQQENVHRLERFHGPFQRTFTIPDTVRYDQIRARLQDGILEVILPKTAGGASRLIQVEVE